MYEKRHDNYQNKQSILQKVLQNYKFILDDQLTIENKIRLCITKLILKEK